MKSVKFHSGSGNNMRLDFQVLLTETLSSETSLTLKGPTEYLVALYVCFCSDISSEQLIFLCNQIWKILFHISLTSEDCWLRSL